MIRDFDSSTVMHKVEDKPFFFGLIEGNVMKSGLILSFFFYSNFITTVFKSVFHKRCLSNFDNFLFLSSKVEQAFERRRKNIFIKKMVKKGKYLSNLKEPQINAKYFFLTSTWQCFLTRGGRLNKPNGVPWTSKSASHSGPTRHKTKLT